MKFSHQTTPWHPLSAKQREVSDTIDILDQTWHLYLEFTKEIVCKCISFCLESTHAFLFITGNNIFLIQIFLTPNGAILVRWINPVLSFVCEGEAERIFVARSLSSGAKTRAFSVPSQLSSRRKESLVFKTFPNWFVMFRGSPSQSRRPGRPWGSGCCSQCSPPAPGASPAPSAGPWWTFWCSA